MIQIILVLLVGFLSTVYLYFHQSYKYWLRKGIPQEKPTFLVGNVLDVVLNNTNFGWIYNELYYKYKDCDAVGMYEFQTPKLLVRNPDVFETILVKEFSSFYDNEYYATLKNDPLLVNNAFFMKGEKWKPARISLVNGLTKSKLKDMYEIMKQTVPLLKNYLDDKLNSDIEAMEVSHLFMMTNVSNTVYGIDENCFADPNSTFRKMIHLYSQDHWQTWWKVIIIFNLQRLRDFLGFTILPKKVYEFVENFIQQVVNIRLKSDIKRRDFMNYYLNLNTTVEEKIFSIVRNGITFFMGGFETSALPSGHLLYELALNPSIQENLYQELEVAYGGKSELDYETIMSLPLLDKALKETLRKYPILYSMNKICTKSCILKINDKQIKIDNGIPVVIPVYAVHHDPQFYPNPEVFDPERFSEEATQSRHPYTWLPFGAGPRICAGKNFGVLQAKLFLASVLHNYKVQHTDKTPPKISFKKSAFLIVPEEAQWIRFVKRR